MNLQLQAEPRVLGKKSDRKDLRKDGMIPGILYGHGRDSVMITINEREFSRVYRKSIGEMAFFDIQLEGKIYRTVIKEKQIHPVKRNVIHVDFMELRSDTEIHVEIPLKFHGDPLGVKKGGVLEITMRALPVTALPQDIHEDIEIDLTNLDLNHALHISELNLGKMKTKLAGDLAVATIHLPRGAKESEVPTEEASK